MAGIRDKVAIIGTGCTKFGERWDAAPSDLMVEAAKECFEDAGIEPKDIDAAWQGTAFEYTGMTALPLAQTLKLPFIPVTRVENACATGSEALRAASYAVACGAYDICLALGVEKLKDIGYGGLPTMGAGIFGGPGGNLGANVTAPGLFAMMATRYFALYGLSPEEGKGTLAHISWKSHKNGALSPKAHLQREVPMDTIKNAPIVAWPLGLFDCWE
jgi:acetyl-CoA C-acetyltransferase